MPRRSSPGSVGGPRCSTAGCASPTGRGAAGIAGTGAVLGVQAAAGVRAEAAQGVIEVGLGGHQPPHRRGGGQTQQHPGSGGQLQRGHDATPGVRRAWPRAQVEEARHAGWRADTAASTPAPRRRPPATRPSTSGPGADTPKGAVCAEAKDSSPSTSRVTIVNERASLRGLARVGLDLAADPHVLGDRFWRSPSSTCARPAPSRRAARMRLATSRSPVGSARRSPKRRSDSSLERVVVRSWRPTPAPPGRSPPVRRRPSRSAPRTACRRGAASRPAAASTPPSHRVGRWPVPPAVRPAATPPPPHHRAGQQRRHEPGHHRDRAAGGGQPTGGHRQQAAIRTRQRRRPGPAGAGGTGRRPTITPATPRTISAPARPASALTRPSPRRTRPGRSRAGPAGHSPTRPARSGAVPRRSRRR